MSQVLTPTVLAVFDDRIESIKFVQDGNVVDPLVILQGLASGALRVTYSEKLGVFGTFAAVHMLSKTFTIEPTGK